jgi:hypothetical protein
MELLLLVFIVLLKTITFLFSVSRTEDMEFTSTAVPLACWHGKSVCYEHVLDGEHPCWIALTSAETLVGEMSRIRLSLRGPFRGTMLGSHLLPRFREPQDGNSRYRKFAGRGIRSGASVRSKSLLANRSCRGL